MKYSILLPFEAQRPEQLLPYGSLVEWTGLSRLWTGQLTHIEPHQAFGHLAGSGIRVPVGIGVTLMPLRHPYEAAVQARSLARVTGHPATVGYAPGAMGFQTALMGSPYARQLGAVRDYLTIVRGLTQGRLVEHDGQHYAYRGRLGPGPRVEIAVGVLRPGMAKLAGEVADAAITWLTPARYIADVLRPALVEGAQPAGRPTPRIVAMVPLSLATRNRLPGEMALASNGIHLAQPHYRDMLALAGVELPGTDALADAEAIVRGGAFLYGDLPELVARLEEYDAAGVDEVVLNLTGIHQRLGDDVTRKDVKILIKALDLHR